MKLRPMLFSTPMVQAILAKTKTQTRRIVKNPERLEGLMHEGEAPDWCPYGKVGDVIWVRETFTELVGHHRISQPTPFVYRADCAVDTDEYRQDYIKAGYPYQWKPSLFMPYDACRIWLEIVSIRVERLQDISQDDSFYEGVDWRKCPIRTDLQNSFYDYTAGYRDLWESINGKGSWEQNPFVWVVEFKRTDKPN